MQGDFELITPETFDACALGYYRNRVLSREAFESSLYLMFTAKGDITKYLNAPDDQLLRMIVNKLVIMSNEFGLEGAQRLIFFRCRTSIPHVEVLRTIWSVLKLMDEPLLVSEGFTIDEHVSMNLFVADALGKMINTRLVYA